MGKQQKNQAPGLLDQFAVKRAKRQGDNQDEESLSLESTHRKPEHPLDAHLNVRVTKTLRDRAKLYAVQSDMTLQELVADALEEYMNRHA